jgi:hypothetical protein
MPLPLDVARCQGFYPDETPCPRRQECLRFTEQERVCEWVVPEIVRGHCADRLTAFWVGMMAAMGGCKKRGSKPLP